MGVMQSSELWVMLQGHLVWCEKMELISCSHGINHWKVLPYQPDDVRKQDYVLSETIMHSLSILVP